MMVGNTRFGVDPKHRIDPFTPPAAFDTQHIGFAYLGTRFTPCAAVFRKIKCWNARIVQNNDLLFTGSDTCFGLARHTLTLKKRFILSIRGTKHQWRCLGLLSRPEGPGERAKKFASRCHLLYPCVHHIDEVRLGFESIIFAEVWLEGVTHNGIDVGLRCVAL